MNKEIVPPVRKHNGWSILHSSRDGDRKSVSLPHRTWFGAFISLAWDTEYGMPIRKIVDHDAEMRRWGYDMGLIEPTLEERWRLPEWHRNYLPSPCSGTENK